MSIKRQRRHRKRKKENTDTHSEYSFNVLILHSFCNWMHLRLLTKYLVFFRLIERIEYPRQCYPTMVITVLICLISIAITELSFMMQYQTKVISWELTLESRNQVCIRPEKQSSICVGVDIIMWCHTIKVES